MDTSNKRFSSYDTGADFWRDNAVRHGVDEATVICGGYLNMNLHREHSDYERQFCLEIFRAMYEATTDKVNSTKLVYLHDFKEANERGEVSGYQESRQHNNECARGIDSIISSSCYRTNFYNLEIAAFIAIMNYGFDRVNLALAFNIQKRCNDGRYSSANKRWFQTFSVPEQAFSGTYLHSHACLIDSFAGYVRELYSKLEL